MDTHHHRGAPASDPVWLRILRLLGPGVLFAVLTMVMTWPLVTDPAHSIISGITADADVSRWDLWWLKTALLDRHSNPFYTDLLYYPYRNAAQPLPLYYHTLQPLNGLLALPVLLLTDATTGPTLAYNLLVLGHFIAGGWAMYALVRYLTGSVAGALVAGTLFTFSPFHQYHLHEAQLELIPLEWAPLFLLFLHRRLYAPPGAGRRRDTLLAAGSLIAVSYTSWYWALYLLLAGAGLAAWRIFTDRASWRRTSLAFGAVLLGWAVCTGPFLWATARAAGDPTFELVSGLDYEVRFSLNPLDLFTVAKDLRLTPAVWFMGPLGLSALLLGVLGVFQMRNTECRMRSDDAKINKIQNGDAKELSNNNLSNLAPDLALKRQSNRIGYCLTIPKNETTDNDPGTVSHSAFRIPHSAFFWLLLAVSGALLALGPYLNLNDAQDVAHSTGLPLPYLLVRNLPFLSIARVPRRFVLLANLGLDVLAGAGAAYCVTRARGWVAGWDATAGRVAGVATTVALLAWPLAEFAVLPQPLHPVTLSPFFTRLAAEPGNAALLELPITAHYLHDHQRMLYQTVHGKPIFGGYVARKVRDYYLEDSSPFHSFLDLEPQPQPDIVPPLDPLAVLNYYRIPYVVAYKADESYLSAADRNQVLAYARSLFPDPAAQVQDDGQLTAYRVPPLSNPPPLIWVGAGWQPVEHDSRRIWRWSKGQAAYLQLLNQTPLHGPLRFVSATIVGQAQLTVRLDDTLLGTVHLVAGEQLYDLGAVTVPPGEHTLTFSADSPPHPANEAGGAANDRRLLDFLLTAVQLPRPGP
ncbi:MAG: hypothetical protein M3Z04_04385 [Chloroflexota bacterium]|nr:hypothetical protein [Chloroflexota bacterium]